MTKPFDGIKPSKSESKADRTDAVVAELLDKERDERQSKTEALKAQREARDEAAATAAQEEGNSPQKARGSKAK